MGFGVRSVFVGMGCFFPSNGASALHPRDLSTAPYPWPCSPQAGRGGRLFVFVRWRLSGPRSLYHFELPQRPPSPPLAGGEAQVRGWSQHAEPRSQKGALFPQTTPLPSTPETTRPPLTPGPSATRLRNPSSWGEGGRLFVFVHKRPGHLPLLESAFVRSTILSFHSAFPLPQELGGEAKVRGWSQHAEPSFANGCPLPQNDASVVHPRGCCFKT